MKKHASGFHIGAYVAGGLVAAYAACGVIIWHDISRTGGAMIAGMPPPFANLTVAIYGWLIGPTFF